MTSTQLEQILGNKAEIGGGLVEVIDDSDSSQNEHLSQYMVSEYRSQDNELFNKNNDKSYIKRISS